MFNWMSAPNFRQIRLFRFSVSLDCWVILKWNAWKVAEYCTIALSPNCLTHQVTFNGTSIYDSVSVRSSKNGKLLLCWLNQLNYNYNSPVIGATVGFWKQDATWQIFEKKSAKVLNFAEFWRILKIFACGVCISVEATLGISRLQN